jgi:hypothetical protein
LFLTPDSLLLDPVFPSILNPNGFGFNQKRRLGGLPEEKCAIHDYFGVDLGEVWRVIERDSSELKLERLTDEAEKNE